MSFSAEIQVQPLWLIYFVALVCYACAIWTGKFKLSAKALKEKPEGYVEPERPARGDRGPRPERRGPRPERRNPEADGARLNRH